jgi:hypothetical protein
LKAVSEFVFERVNEPVIEPPAVGLAGIMLRVESDASIPPLLYELADAGANDVIISNTQKTTYALLAMLFPRHAKHLNPSHHYTESWQKTSCKKGRFEGRAHL